ncbi:MAG: 3-deoxy-manno-octulosonate cytidylyltransferase [bacterium]
MDTFAIIPARFGSARLPGKPLLDLCGKPIIQHVYERVREAGVFAAVLVATDSERIFRCVESFGGDAVMTSPDHRSGTERIAEVASALEARWIVNVQGDEPFVHPEMLRDLCSAFREEDLAPMATLRYPIQDESDLWNPHVVKVVVDESGYALYFSRAAIPYRRTDPGAAEIDGSGSVWYKHVGIYAYRRDFLLRYPSLSVTPLEEAEKLEQLRALGHGHRIRVYTTKWETLGIDTEEDLLRAIDRCRRGS